MIGSWTKLSADSDKMKSFSRRAGQLFEGTKPGDKIKFRFRGTCCKVYDLLGVVGDVLSGTPAP